MKCFMLKKYFRDRQEDSASLQVCIFMAICVLTSLLSGVYADFTPINGTFQNFNPVRRLLAGQIPCRDFYDYLGFGHLYIGTVTTYLFGNNYRVSRIAFSFLSMLGLGLFSLMLSYCITRDKKKSFVISNFILCLSVSGQYLAEIPILGTLFYCLRFAGSYGNSARTTRAIVILFVPLLLYFILKIAKERKFIKSILVGVVAGVAFPFSNDYGISCTLCLLCMFLWELICERCQFKDILFRILLALSATVVGTYVSVQILSVGHFTEWLKLTFGTGNFQSWYYISPKSYYIYDLELTKLNILQVCLIIYYLWKMYRSKGSMSGVFRYGVPAFLNLAALTVVQQYRLFSGGSSRELSVCIIFVTCLAEIVNKMHIKERLLKCCYSLSTCVSLLMVCSLAGMWLYMGGNLQNTAFIEELGGC